MRILFIIIIATLFSCNQKKKEKTNINTTNTKGIIETSTEVEKITETATEQINRGITFKEELQKLKIKSVPLIDSTSFDSFIDENDYKKINAVVLQLPKIYKNWYKKNYNYRAIDAYRLNLSNNFYTIVVTVLEGNDTMKSTLINYNLEGIIIAHEMVAYDEISQDWIRTKAKIEINTITPYYQYTVSEDDGSVLEAKILKIETNGNLKRLGIDKLCYDIVIKELALNTSKLIGSLQAFKMLPNNKNKAIVVIPEIAVGSEKEEYFEYNTHIVIINLETKQITHKYFESHKTNTWVSDAIRLDRISIDTARYQVTNNDRAFGVRVHYTGSSRVNPYENEQLSLYIKSGNTLKKILNNFHVINYGGKWNGDCLGEFIDHKKTLSISKLKNNGLQDITVKNKITKTINYEDENGNCDSKETIRKQTVVLKFNGKVYAVN